MTKLAAILFLLDESGRDKIRKTSYRRSVNACMSLGLGDVDTAAVLKALELHLLEEGA